MLKISIKRPALILDENKCRMNIIRMAEKARKHHLRFRPHFKTHQSAEIGEWFRDYETEAITVSSVESARYFAQSGWDDITIAFPVNIREIDEINQLAAKIELNLLVVMPETITVLEGYLLNPVGIYIKIDTGSRRTGILPDDEKKINDILERLESCPNLQFKGFLTHAGNAYSADSAEEIAVVHRGVLRDLCQLKEKYRDRYPGLELSMGNTPTCSIMDEFEGIDEIRPGNFAFYDVMQAELGACRYDQIAVALACPIVARHADRNEIVIYGGAVHLSKDVLRREDGSRCYGKVVSLTDSGWSQPLPDTNLRSVSQEHGVIRTSAASFDMFRIGDVIGILPVHSCLTADLMKCYTTLDGWQIAMMKT